MVPAQVPGGRGETVALPETLVDLAASYSNELWRFFSFLFAVVAVYGLARLLVEPTVERVVRRSNPGDVTLQSAVVRHLRLAIVLAAVAGGAVAAGYGQVLTGSNLVIAAATLAIGVAGQEIIGSVISGLFLVANADFNTGDWIQWDDQEGEIVSIHFRTTRVRTPGNEIVTVPNTELTENTVVHRFGLDRIRLVEDVAVTYESDVTAAIDRLEATASTTEPVLETPAPRAYLLELEDDRVVVRLEFWVDDPAPQVVASARSALATAILREFANGEVELGPASEYELDGHVRVSLTDEES